MLGQDLLVGHGNVTGARKFYQNRLAKVGSGDAMAGGLSCDNRTSGEFG
jgi:hypothetical protein